MYYKLIEKNYFSYIIIYKLGAHPKENFMGGRGGRWKKSRPPKEFFSSTSLLYMVYYIPYTWCIIYPIHGLLYTLFMVYYIPYTWYIIYPIHGLYIRSYSNLTFFFDITSNVLATFFRFCYVKRPCYFLITDTPKTI